jgi:pyruvate/2-oxoglutarate dehydrogenase complex dihydrolipoamide dehydrogenase (E3) component
MKKFDAIVIGTGQAGPSLSARLAGAGMKVAIIERKLFGGTCVNTGCIPTKTLVASARAAYMARRAADFGVMIDGPITVDMKKVKARKDDVAGRSNHEIPDWMKKISNLTVFKGHARFEGPHTVNIGDVVLKADKIFINVGGRAFVPPMPGLDQINYFTNSSMMQIDYLPEHLIIIGGSYIGLEFAQMYRRFGSQVTIVEKGSRLISRDDEDVSEAVKDILGAAILGIGGDEAIHSILDIMYAKQPYTLIQRAMHIHPTVSELIPTMLGELKPLH